MKLRLFSIPALYCLFLIIAVYVACRIPRCEKNPDCQVHIDYIRYVFTNADIPAINAGWEMYHPPLYYALVALLAGIVHPIGISLVTAARYFSLLCAGAFALYGLLFLQRAIRNARVQYLCAAVFLSWPLWLGLFARISNEVLLYPLWVCCYYHLLGWHQRQQSRDLVIAIVLCALMMLVKVSALVPLATVVAVMCYHLMTRRRSVADYCRPGILVAAAFVAVAVSGDLARTIYYKGLK